MDRINDNYVFEGELLDIITYPNKVLTTKAVNVTEFNDELKTLCKNMLFTMYHAPGIGLAAPQVGLSKRLFVIDTDYKREETEEDSGQFEYSEFMPKIFINPTIRNQVGEIVYEEGCLSLPDVFEDVKRFESITVDYFDTDGKPHSMDASALLSIAAQHENDHLDGIVFIERLSLLKKKLIHNYENTKYCIFRYPRFFCSKS
jgi:peptide deformylase